MKSIIFDMDGVIVDSEPLFADFLPGFLREIGIAEPAKFTGDYKGRNSHGIWGLFL